MQETVTNLLSETLDKVNSWAVEFFAMLPNIGVALVVMLLAWLASKGTGRVVARTMPKLSDNQQLASLAVRFVRLLTIAVGLFISLGVLELEKTVASLVAGLGVVGLALGFAFQDIAANFMSGLLMAMQRPFRIGDYIETDGHTGTVQSMDLRSTVLVRTDGVHVMVPNQKVFGNAILNYTREDPRRIDVAVGVAYDSDLPTVVGVARDAVKDVPNRIEDRDVDVLFTEFGGSSIDLVVRFWSDNSRPGGWLESRSAAIMAIHAAFGAEEIEIPFPIRTLDVPQALLERVGPPTEPTAEA